MASFGRDIQIYYAGMALSGFEEAACIKVEALDEDRRRAVRTTDVVWKSRL